MGRGVPDGAGETARLVAFLRGINLGNRRVKMDRLRAHFEELELEGVSSFLASGNVVFEDPGRHPGDLEKGIEVHLEDALGFRTRVFLRSLAALERLTDRDDSRAAEAEGFTPYVIFLRDEAEERITEELAALETPDDRFHVHGREVLWLRRGRLTDAEISLSDLRNALGGPDHTRRKLNTVRRIVARYAGSSE